MFRLQIQPPGHGKLKRAIAVFQKFDCFGIGDALKLIVQDGGGGGQDGGINPLVEKLHILPAMLQDKLENKLEKASARSMSPSRSQKAISGSTIQNSAR